ncbi:MAG: hypothetical protein ACREBD_35340, partial [Blastocatellia bacterium]
MKLTNEEMRRFYQRQSSRTIAGHAECLSEDVITRAAIGEPDQTDRQMIADHLAVCSDCAQEYRLLRSLKPLIEQAAVLAPESESALEPVVERQDKEERVVPSQPSLLRRFISSGVAAYAGAAALLVICLACVVLIISLRRQNAELAAQLKEQVSRRNQASQSVAETNDQLAQAMRRAEQQQQEITELRRSIEDFSQPQVNAPITDLDPQSVRGDTEKAVTTVTVPKGSTLFTVILHVAGGPSYSEYALEILDGQGRPVRRVKGLYRSPADTFTVALSRRLLPAGRYRLRLYGL